MLLDEGVDSLPVAAIMHIASRQIIDDIEGDEIFLQFPLTNGMLAQGTVLLDCRPFLDAKIAKGVTESKCKYPQMVRTGSSKTSWQMLHLRWRLIFSGYKNSRFDLVCNL